MRIQKNRQIGDCYAIYVEGECEFWYVQMLKRNEKKLRIKLEPSLQQTKKLSEQFATVIKLSDDYTKVFWIVDFDVIIKETKESIKGETPMKEFENYCKTLKSKYKNVIVIINNPCFEYWFLLHFESISKHFDNCNKVIQQLKKHKPLNDYVKNQIYYTKQNNDIYLKLKPFLEQAIKNSNNLKTFDFKNPYSGMTQMQLLFDNEILGTKV